MAEPKTQQSKISEDDVQRMRFKKALARKKRKEREAAGEIHGLNLTAMMDMMTIILVFLLKSLSSSSTNIPQGDNLRLPGSSVTTAPSSALQVMVSRANITVNGRFIAPLNQEGKIDPALKRGGGTGYIINPLADNRREAIQVVRRTNPRNDNRLDIAIIADLHTPSRTVYEVLYTCGQAGFNNFQLMVLKNRTS